MFFGGFLAALSLLRVSTATISGSLVSPDSFRFREPFVRTVQPIKRSILVTLINVQNCFEIKFSLFSKTKTSDFLNFLHEIPAKLLHACIQSTQNVFLFYFMFRYFKSNKEIDLPCQTNFQVFKYILAFELKPVDNQSKNENIA